MDVLVVKQPANSISMAVFATYLPHHFLQHQQHQQLQETLQPSYSSSTTSTSIAIMQLSSIRNFTLAILAGSALALPARIEDTRSLANIEVSQSAVFARNLVSMEKLTSEQAKDVVEKRITVAIALLSVIGGKLFAGAAAAGIEVAKDALAPAAEDWKDFDEVS